MAIVENSNIKINENIKSQLEEIVESIDNSIIRSVPEDLALIGQAYSSDAGNALCEKYTQFTNEISSMSRQLQQHIETIDSNFKRNL